ncbi:inositol monophosphatase family protein [Pseudooceanicola sp. C21-150M6]|uniref:inositol monophosphatase family protein n=1 Tax=Pseudooceanicola sp. C21-150M6 TaxID=3434355 RepID=UPI003D7FC613
MPDNDPDIDLAADFALLTDAAKDAGKLALTFSGPRAERWDKPDDQGPVTEADLAVDAMLRDRLLNARPDYGWLSEETPDTDNRLGKKRCFIIDPIDGTRSFIEGSETWAHSLAIAEEGEIVAAAVYLPVKGKLYAAALGRGAHLNDRPLRVSGREDLDGARVLAAKPNYDARHWPRGVPNVSRHYRPSLAYRLSLVAEGRYDAMLTFRDSWEWDIAAGELILREAGAITSTRTGAALRFNNPEPLVDGVIAAGPALHGRILDALR